MISHHITAAKFGINKTVKEREREREREIVCEIKREREREGKTPQPTERARNIFHDQIRLCDLQLRKFLVIKSKKKN